MQLLDPMAKAKMSEAARVKNLVFQAGLTFSLIDRNYKLKPGTARDTLRYPQPYKRS